MSDNIPSSIERVFIFKKDVLTSVFVFLLYLSFFTISWDIVSVYISRNTFRLTQLCMFFCFVIWAIIKVGMKSFKFRNSGLVEKWAILFALWCIGTDITSYNLKRSIFYSFWLIFSLATIALVVEYVGTSRDKMRQIFRLYLYSFVWISIIGFARAGLQYMGLISVGIDPETGQQQEAMFRASGFCYEPSYFACYLITCLTALSYLKLRGSKILKELGVKRWHYFAILIAFVGSFSRAGFVVFLPIVFIFIAYELVHAIKYRNCMVSRWFVKACLFLTLFLSLAGFVLVSKADIAKDMDQYFFSGMGIGYHKDSAHSSGTRLIETTMTLQAGIMNPWMGVGMGGFGKFFVENIKKFPMRELWLGMAVKDALRKANKWTFIEVRYPEAMNVSLEVFACTGIPGLILWLIVNFIIPYRLIMLSKSCSLDSGMRELLRAMAYGHIALFVILHINQNFMRPYYWLNIAMCCSLYLVAKSCIANNKAGECSKVLITK